ncbi:MAG: hypothetical protein HYZ42_12730 [Bacteroidetes bacterium]|nr:hypothetical protein [Bacteroidota bacterium]
MSKFIKHISLVVLVLSVLSITFQTTISSLYKNGLNTKNTSLQQPLTEEEESQDTDELEDEELLFFVNPIAYISVQQIKPIYEAYIQLAFPVNYKTIQIPPPKA